MKMTQEDMKAMLGSKRLPCKRCNGTGKMTRYNGAVEPCTWCDGAAYFANPLLEVKALLEACKGRGGAFRRSRPDRAKGSRAYYIWRIARFHGGVDVCMPMMAELDVEGDPYKPLLEQIAEEVAKKVFGTDMAAAYRWGAALGTVKEAPEGLPMTAYPNGPAVLEA